MFVFWLCIAIMIFIALGAAIYPLLSKQTNMALKQAVLGNENLYREQLDALKEEYLKGELTDEVYSESHQELTTAFALEPEAEVFQYKQKRKIVLAVVIFIFLPCFVLYLYAGLGDPVGVKESQQLSAAAQKLHKQSNAFQSPGQVIATLVRDVKEHPKKVQGWILLGRLYMSLQQFSLAAPAYAKAYGLRPHDIAILEQYIEALYFANHNRLTPEAKQLVQQALKADPNDLKMLNLQALDAYVRGEDGLAIKKWEAILAILPQKDPQRQSVVAAINKAKARMQFKHEKPTIVIPVTLHLAKSLQRNLPKHAYLMVFAKAKSGSQMPLAILKQPLAGLPTSIRLTDKMAITPSETLNDYHQVIVIARISKTGQARPLAGDLQGQSQPFDPRSHTKRIQIEINQIVK